MSKETKNTELSEDKALHIGGVRQSTSRKGTGLYMITMTALCGLLGGVGWYHLWQWSWIRHYLKICVLTDNNKQSANINN